VNLPYWVRLLGLSLASFFLVNLVAGLVVSALATAAGRFAKRMGAREGARFLLVLRFVPLALGACVVGCLCVPSYLWMEPAEIDEPVSWLCLLAASLAVLAWLHAAARAVRAVVRSGRFLRLRPVSSRTICIDGETFPVTVTDSVEPLFAQAGIVRPRLLVSPRAVDAFPGEELACALRHEQAHGYSRDNLKRLAMMVAPEVLPFIRTMRPLERVWAGLAEWAADDHACGGSPQRSVSLAAALVRTARMSAPPAPPPALVTALLASDEDLTVRVDRLLNPGVAAQSRNLSGGRGRTLAIAGCAFCAVIVMLHPVTLFFAHDVLERLVH
jgi:hypothetical protein